MIPSQLNLHKKECWFDCPQNCGKKVTKFEEHYKMCENSILTCVCGKFENKRGLIKNHQKNCAVFLKISKLEEIIFDYGVLITKMENKLQKEKLEKIELKQLYSINNEKENEKIKTDFKQKLKKNNSIHSNLIDIEDYNSILTEKSNFKTFLLI